MKFIVVAGGVLSGLGKGVITSSIGLLLKECGYKITVIKVDPYLNVDAGTMNPFEHGEVFVLDDGTEVDLDLGNYERFLDINLTSEHNITTGKVYQSVIQKERKGEYLGKTVQIIPHIMNEIISRFEEVSRNTGAEITLIELGGTVGDIESMPFLEAVRELRNKHGKKNVLVIHSTLVPVLGVVGEQKTKPTQHSVKELMRVGIQPDIIMCRSKHRLSDNVKRKISLFCNIKEEEVFSVYDVEQVHQVPLLFEEENVSTIIQKKLKLNPQTPDLTEWEVYVRRLTEPQKEVKIALVGKYTGLKDSYISHLKALTHSSSELDTNCIMKWVSSEDLERDDKRGEKAWNILKNVQGILIPGGFGIRGIEGKIAAVEYARNNKVPFLGICLGFEMAVIEYSRNQVGLEDANGTEFDQSTPHPVIDLLPEQLKEDRMGATMRRGAHRILINKDSRAYDIYGTEEILERHRHRYEVNPDYISRIQGENLIFSGKSPDGRRMEILELKDHPFFFGCQFHPEFRSKPQRPAPIFLEFLRSALQHNFHVSR